MQHLEQKRGEVGLLDTPAEERRRGGQAADFLGQDVQKFGRRIGPAVGQVGLEVIPDAFVGVQLRGVGREGLQVEAGRAAEERLHGLAAMNAAILRHGLAGMRSLPSVEPPSVLLARRQCLIPPRA